MPGSLNKLNETRGGRGTLVHVQNAEMAASSQQHALPRVFCSGWSHILLVW